MSNIKMISIPKDEYDRLTRLSGKTGFCLQCEQYAKEIEGLKAELEVLSIVYKKDETVIFKLNEYNDQVIKERDRYRAAAEGLAESLDLCIKWIEPVMDGFSVGEKQKNGEPSARIVVLNKAKESRGAWEKVRP